MKNALLLSLLPLLLLTACLFDKDDEGGSLEHTFTGPIEGLEEVQDAAVNQPRWRLYVDLGDERVLRGFCNYKGYLGDSASVMAEDPVDLYTNTAMGGSRKATEFRAEGVIIAMDSVQQRDTLTHYRADFTCTY